MRKPVFDAIRDAREASGKPRSFNVVEAAVIDDLLDRLGVKRDDAPQAPPAIDPLPVAGGDTFEACLAVILKHEGGYVNHVRDPGGMTNLGVTKKTWEAWVGEPVSEAEMRNLTREDVAPLYHKKYWLKVSADKLPPGLALCVFDFAVNAGTNRAARYLQKMVATPQDGIVGPQTLAAATGYLVKHGERHAIASYQAARRIYYRGLKNFPTFGKGWLRRVSEVEATATEWAR